MRSIDVDELKEPLKEYQAEQNVAKCGKWEKIPQGCRWWICTQCNHIINRVVLPSYCECCGSKMDGGKE